MPHIYRFDDVEIDLRNFRVLKAGKVVSLEPKALNVLVFLTEHRGRLVEKRELIDAVWGEAFVTENVLTRVIAQLRKALGDDAKECRYIETVPTRGYRFVAGVATENDVDTTDGGQGKLGEESPERIDSLTTPQSHEPRRHRFAIVLSAVVGIACLGALAVFVSRWNFRRSDLQIASDTQVTTSSGLSFYPTFSPDSTEIAYSTDRGKGFEIFVRQLAPGGKEFQITSDGNQNMQPAWSPEGSMIAYYSRNRGGIWVMPALGGTPRKLTDFGSHPAWSHDAHWIVFASGSLDDLSSDSTGIEIPSTIWAIRPDGSDAKKISSAGRPDGGHGSPSWSPDGEHIVFVSSFQGRSSLWSIGANGSGLVQLGERGTGYYDPIYSPDGKSVLYGASAPGHDAGLWQLRVSEMTSSPIGQPVQIINSGASRIKNLAFSSDGKRLVYASVGLTGGLQSLTVSKSTDPVGEPVSLMSDVGCRDILPIFSPDGSRVAFVSCHGRAGARQQIWLVNPDGSELQQLTSPPSSFVDPNWYPDGHRILVTEDTGQLLSVDVDTRQRKVVAKLDRNFASSRLSPDGTKIAMNLLNDGIQNVWIMDLANGKMKQITFDKEDAGYPAWSPDGKSTAIEIERGPDNGIAVVPSDGGAATELTSYHGQHWLRDWSPDNDKVLFAMPGEDMIWNIWSVSRSTKIEKQLTHYTKTNAFVRYPAASPRGNQIVYEYTETTGNIWMIEFK